MLSKGEKLCADGREYTVLELLGKGANAAAFLAECRHGGLTSKCILKECISGDKERFIASGRMQNEIRQLSALGNQTPPVSHIFEVGDTEYIDVTCFGGATLDKLSLTLSQYIAVCLTVAKTVGYYHKAGCLCLDLKPDNIFVLQNAPDDTVTQLVEFIDFDSVRRLSELDGNAPLAYTADWCAPEQRSPFAAGKITEATDIYALGELVFFTLFGRHSTEREHRGFSKYPFDVCPKQHRRFTDRPDVCGLFTRLFRGTLRSSPANRFDNVSEVISLLESLVTELEKRDYIIPKLPTVPPYFFGRDSELAGISESLKKDNVLFVTGIGGIGKSALVKAFIRSHKTDYDVIIYLEFDGDFVRTFCDDMQLQLSTVSRQDGEPADEYFTRKLTHLRRICGVKKVLFVLDNFSGRITKELSKILYCGYDTIIVTRNRPPQNSFPIIEVVAISDSALMKLISLNLGRTMTKDERSSFAEIITLVQGHTLVLELIARQISVGRLDIRTARELIREHGFSHFSVEQIGNYKDGEEVYGTLSAIITALFDASKMTSAELLTIKTLALLDVRGLEQELTERVLKLDFETVQNLGQQGWLYNDGRVKLHPVIAETMRDHKWQGIPDTEVMERHKSVIAVYEGTANAEQIVFIIKQAEQYKNLYSRHIINAMLWDMYGSYYDTILNGAYVAYTDEEQELQNKLIEAMDNAISEAEQSADPKRDKYLVQYMLSLAGILIRCDPSYHPEARELLDKVEPLISDDENRCYFCMVNAWYYTLAELDAERTKALTDQAAKLAKTVFTTDIELIDIICIPIANCLFYYYDYDGAAAKLNEAITLCKVHPDQLTYIDKHAELLCCLIDTYAEQGDKKKCRELLAELEEINEKYRDDGIHREPNPETLELIK
ncbi:Serine/threonine protein kinase [Ruminococcaceae bacterium FB2012]|nr:Serine/threonine protein kinase [Ruminococcaceae bacterium FB2012]